MPYRSVVVGTDGSKTATEAVRRAAVFAKAVAVPLSIVVAYERHDTDDTRPQSERAKTPGEYNPTNPFRVASEAAGDAAGEARAAAPGITVEQHALEGDAAARLVDAAGPLALLVVGSQGMTGSARFLLGSVPDKVSHHARGDVLIVRTGAGGREGAPRRLLLATDGSASATHALDRGLAIAAALGATATLFTVGRGRAAESTLATAAERAAAAGVQALKARRDGDPAEEIVAAAADHDLLVLGSLGMTGAARFLLGSVPNKVSHHAPADLLIVKTE